MSAVRRRDLQVLVRELLRPGWLGFLAMAVALSSWYAKGGWQFVLPVLALGAAVLLAWGSARHKVFRQQRLHRAWVEVKDRSGRLLEELRTARKHRVADLSDLPRNVCKVRDQLYLSLRKADLLLHEVAKSERGAAAPPAHLPPSGDPQAQELYRLADRHLAEYRRRYGALVSSAERTEAQAVVFVTMLDALRVQLLQHRLGRSAADPDTHEFMVAVTEAKMQLDAIDKTLEELELSPFPKTVSVVPEAPRESGGEAQEHQA